MRTVLLILIFCFIIFFSDTEAFNYTAADLPLVHGFNYTCTENQSLFVALWELRHVKMEEINQLRAVVYELPSGESHQFNVDIKNSTISMPDLRKYTRYVAFLTVKLRNATGDITDWLSLEHKFITCGTEDSARKCLCDPTGSLNNSTNCQPGTRSCVCSAPSTGPDCSVCVDKFYRDYANYKEGCKACQCGGHFAGPCIWQRISDIGDAKNNRKCLGCLKGYGGDACSPENLPKIGLGAQVALGLACVLGILFIFTMFVTMRRHCRRRALRAARHSLAVQRLFSRFKDDSSLEAEASAILTEEDALHRTTQQLRLGSDPVYQPTTISIT